MTDDSIFLIDIEKILKTKAGEKYKYIPRFVVSYLKRIVHQEELNVFLKDSRNKVGVDFLEACMGFLDAKVEIKGLENLPEGGRCTFVSNHPLGGQDGVALGYILGKHYNGNVRYLVNDLLMNLHGLAPLCIPINKTGSQSRDLSVCFPQGCVPAGRMGKSRIWSGKRLLSLKVLKRIVMWCLCILRAGILIPFIIWRIYVRHLALSSISLCFTWRMKC